MANEKKQVEMVTVRRISGTEENPVMRVTQLPYTNEEGTKYLSYAFAEDEEEFQIPANVARQITDVRTEKEKEEDPRANYKKFYFEVTGDARPKSLEEINQPGKASANNKAKRNNSTPEVTNTTPPVTPEN